VSGLVPVNPQGGKLSRAQAILPFVAAGNVWLPSPQEQPWVEQFLTEARSFPVGAHDDQVDAMSQGLQWFHPHKEQQEAVDPMEGLSRRSKEYIQGMYERHAPRATDEYS
jgi:phage terminase large subunit-like protein